MKTNASLPAAYREAIEHALDLMPDKVWLEEVLACADDEHATCMLFTGILIGLGVPLPTAEATGSCYPALVDAVPA